jgi:hypothetical protein
MPLGRVEIFIIRSKLLYKKHHIPTYKVIKGINNLQVPQDIPNLRLM